MVTSFCTSWPSSSTFQSGLNRAITELTSKCVQLRHDKRQIEMMHIQYEAYRPKRKIKIKMPTCHNEEDPQQELNKWCAVIHLICLLPGSEQCPFCCLFQLCFCSRAVLICSNPVRGRAMPPTQRLTLSFSSPLSFLCWCVWDIFMSQAFIQPQSSAPRMYSNVPYVL